MNRPGWNLLTGTLARYVLLAVNIILGVLLMPFTVQHLGKAEYGLWMLAASFTAYLQLLDLGYGNGLVRQVAHADARQDEQEMNVILSTFFVVYTGIGIVALSAVGVLAAFMVPRFPGLSPAEVRTAQIVLTILGARIAVAFPMGVFGAVTTARQRFALTTWIAVGIALLQGLATYVVLSLGYSLIVLVSVTTAIGVSSYIAYAAAAVATFPAMRLSPSRFSIQQVREVTAFSVYIFLISIAVHIGTNLDNVIVGAYVGTAAVAVYTVALRLAEYQRQMCGQFSAFLFPLIVRLDASHDTPALRATMVDGTRLALGLVGGVTICLLTLGNPLVHAWMGPDFSESVVPLYVLALGGLVMVAQGPSGSLLLAAGRHRFVAGASVLEILLNVLLSLALVKPLGLVGVALGTVLPYAVLNLFLIVPMACRQVGLATGGFVREVLTPTAIASIPALALAMLLRSVNHPGSLLEVVLHGALIGSTYVLAFGVIGLRAQDRARYVDSLKQMTVRLPAARPATL